MGVDITNWRLGRHYTIDNSTPTAPVSVFKGWGVQRGRVNTALHDFSPDIKKRADWEDGLVEADKGYSDFDTWAASEWGSWWTGKALAVKKDIHRVCEHEYLDEDDAP